jgi:alpha-glucosidase
MPTTDLAFNWGNTPSFWFDVRRKSTNESLFSTQNTKIVYENQFLEFVTQLPANYNISGLGEHIHALELQPGFVATNWNADIADPTDSNMYGTHPFYMETRYSQNATSQKVQGASHGVYLRNSHGLEVVFGDQSLTWRAIGGSIELYFMDGPTPADVTAQYTSGIVGLPAMQQYWTFGFHQCHWGYANWSDVQYNIDQYRANDIPLETQWVDIDYMDAYVDFTTDPVHFPAEEGQDLIGKLHNASQHFIPIIDAALWWPGSITNYTSYNHGHDLDIFIKNPDGTEYVGSVWPGNAVWPDWLNPQAEEFWADEIAGFHEQLGFDGIWNDMNEPSSFCTGSCGTESPPAGAVEPGQRDVSSPPYAINNVQGELSAKTVATNATQYGGVQHYDVHNIFGYGLLKATNAGLQKAMPGKRPFIIGRSTFAGVGKYSGHWGGDNSASWQLMYWSIPQALTNALFGIPMFGPDTCGFAGDTTEEQCGRWMQLSAFFPFYRNHYGIGGQGREAWRMFLSLFLSFFSIRYIYTFD